MKKSKKWGKHIIALGITLLIAVFLIEQFIYQQKIGDEFYSSAIPNDPVRLGMRPYDVKSVLGNADEKLVMKDIVATGYGNDIVMGKTGEIILKYNMRILDEDATIDYSYYKKANIINSVFAFIGYYKTLDEAIAVADQLLYYAETVFEQKGDYTFKENISEYSCLSYNFIAKNQNYVFSYSVYVKDNNDDRTHHIDRDDPYYINIHQSLSQINPTKNGSAP